MIQNNINNHKQSAIDMLTKFDDSITIINQYDFMNIKLKIDSKSCKVKSLTIRGIEADYEDFGYTADTSYNEFYNGCYNMKFIKKEYSDIVATKYKLDRSDYESICNMLEDNLSYGRCKRCLLI